MLRKVTTYFLLVTLTIPLCAAGCGGRGKPKAPKLDPVGMASKAMELYDANGNRKIDGAEFDKTPALAFALKEMDKDRDKALSVEEIQRRLEAWQASGITLTSPEFVCKIKGKTVTEGTLRLVPEPFLGESYAVAEGEFVNETCQPKAPNPGDYCAIPLGFYNVEVTSPVGSITLGSVGVEVFDDSYYFQKHRHYVISD